MSCHGSGSVVVLDDSLCTGCPGGSDWTTCINETVASLGNGGTLQFKRGEEYVVSDSLWILAEGMTWEAVGEGPRPIIRFINSPSVGGVLVKKPYVSLRNLDIRGPHYNSGGTRTLGRYGISAAQSVNEPTSDHLETSDVSVNGFEDAGLYINGQTSDVLVNNSEFSFNGGSGIQLFPLPDNGPAPVGVTIQGCSCLYNGEDGIDSCALELIIQASSFIDNGWANPIYSLDEGHGILLNADAGDRTLANVIIQNNHITSNALVGIYLLNPGQWSYDKIDIKSNYLIGNGTEGRLGWQWGVLIETTSITNSTLDENDAFANPSGCYSIPSSGVSVGGNCCDGVGGPGPGGGPCLE